MATASPMPGDGIPERTPGMATSPDPDPKTRRPRTAPTTTSGGAGKGSGGASYPESVQRLIDEFAGLPGIGRKSAERLAFHVLKAGKTEALALARAISEVKRTVRHCSVCFNLADVAAPVSADADATAHDGSGGAADNSSDSQGLCSICAAPLRDRSLVMVVEQPKDLIALEQTGMYKGVYHVLMGRISPLEGVGPGDVTIADLLRRIDDPSSNCGSAPVKEIILALNPTMEADGTALYIADQLRRRGVTVTRLARGVPTGSQLEFASKAVLADAIEGRRPMG